MYIIPDKIKVNGEAYRVVGINKKAFKNCKYLETVSIPATIEYIGEYAFKGCKLLKNLRIPQTVSRVAENALDGCDSLPIFLHRFTDNPSQQVKQDEAKPE